VVGEDAELAVAETYQCGAGLLFGHALRRFAHRGGGSANDRASLGEQLSDRPLGRIEHSGQDRGVGSRPSEQAPCDVAQPCGAGEQRHHPGGRKAIAQGVFAGAGLESGRQARQHRRMSEQLALAEEIEHPPAVDELHCAATDDPDVLHRGFALAEDRGAGGEVLDLDRVGH
jgi:hypothetical protein